MTSVLQTVSTNFTISMLLDINLPTNLVQTWYDDRHHLAVHIDTSLCDLDSRSQRCTKAETSAPIIAQSPW